MQEEERDKEKMQAEKERRKRNFVIRLVLSIVMGSVFACFIKMGRIYLIALIIFLNCVVFYEVLKVFLRIYPIKNILRFAANSSRRDVLMPSEFFWCCFLMISISKYSRIMIFPGKLAMVHRIVVPLQFVWIGWFVLLLRGGAYRMKIFHLSMVLVAIIGLLECTEAAINNVDRSIYCFVYPCFLVAINDTFAYLIGARFGQTPLTQLSPKKTVEGFIGGGVATVLLCIPVSYLLKMFLPHTPKLQYTDMLILSILASVVAPIGGILASGYKRAFKAKHFSRILPGHGGISDRIDCQLIMQLVSNLYLSGIVRKQTVKGFLAEIKQHLTDKEQLDLARMIVLSYKQ
ncbi:phosphatidate cytidylyltransferase [Nematocida sp. AWRm78]|nr:phosphatidate cytidylyltransferase [Nematocida sp. AWRm79]KAI5185429.1 phosphatidate cytidylyltransferase [Nematocida sp. AWRm78]